MRATIRSSSASGARRRTLPASRIRTSSRSTTAARPRAPTTSRWSTSKAEASRTGSSPRGPLAIPAAIEATRQILRALGFAHRGGIVHRDVKPHNVLLAGRAERRYKVTDFGISRTSASQMTEAGSIVGTAQYLSPEQARGAPVDQRSDIYSVGIVLYELLTGQLPFTGETPLEIAMNISPRSPSLPPHCGRRSPPTSTWSCCGRSRRIRPTASRVRRRWTRSSRGSPPEAT